MLHCMSSVDRDTRHNVVPICGGWAVGIENTWWGSRTRVGGSRMGSGLENGSASACVDCCGSVLARVGLRWPLLTVIGCH